MTSALALKPALSFGVGASIIVEVGVYVTVEVSVGVSNSADCGGHPWVPKPVDHNEGQKHSSNPRPSLPRQYNGNTTPSHFENCCSPGSEKKTFTVHRRRFATRLDVRAQASPQQRQAVPATTASPLTTAHTNKQLLNSFRRHIQYTCLLAPCLAPFTRRQPEQPSGHTTRKKKTISTTASKSPTSDADVKQAQQHQQTSRGSTKLSNILRVCTRTIATSTTNTNTNKSEPQKPPTKTPTTTPPPSRLTPIARRRRRQSPTPPPPTRKL